MDSSTLKMAGNTQHSQLTSFLLKENQNLLQIQKKDLCGRHCEQLNITKVVCKVSYRI